MPPLCRTNAARGSELDLYSIAYRSTRGQLDRVRLSTLSRSEVHMISAAKGSSVGKTNRCSCRGFTPSVGGLKRRAVATRGRTLYTKTCPNTK